MATAIQFQNAGRLTIRLFGGLRPELFLWWLEELR